MTHHSEVVAASFKLVVAEKIARWQRLKALVLDSVSSPIAKGRRLLQSDHMVRRHNVPVR
jgi:hypothetical protein